MFKLSKRRVANAFIAVGAIAVVVAFGAGQITNVRPTATTQYVLPPTSKIVLLPPFLGPASDADMPIGRLDTVTGAIYRLHGNLENPSVRNTWRQRVPPVEGETSGLLDIQTVSFQRNAPVPFAGKTRTFLVDNVTGRTWVLRPTASTNGLWKEVKVFD